MDEEVYTVEDIFERDTPLSEGILGLSEGPTLSPITMLRRYMAEKELKKQKENAEETLDELEMSFADGGMAGDKTYHQVRDQFMPMDSESMGYAYGGGVGSMMQPRMNFAGGGGDFIGLNPNGPITIEDLTETDNNGNFLISAAEALPDQTGTINSAPSITNKGLRTIEGSLIDGDDPSSRYAVQQDFPTSQSLPSSAAIAAALGSTGSNQLEGYQDMIMNPEGFPNALQNLERFQDNRFSDLDFQPGYDFIDAPNKTNTLSDLYQNRNYIDNPRTGFFDKNIMSKGNPDASLMNKTKSGIGSIMDFMGKIPTPMNLVKNIFNRDPNAPSYKTYSPNIDYSKLNTTNLNDFYDDNPLSETYGTTRFDRAKPGSFASFRTLADYFNRNKKKAEKIGITRREEKEAAAAAAANRAGQIAAQRGADVGVSGGGRGSRRGDADIGNSQRGGFATDDTAGFFARGGRVGYRDGGIVSLRK